MAGLLPTPPVHEWMEGDPIDGIARATYTDWTSHLQGLESWLDEPTEALRIHLLERTTEEAMESQYTFSF
jgi:hypothetical protein